GSLGASHDGTEAEEEMINQLTGPTHPGLAVCVSAGNDRGGALHSGDIFGPLRAGELNRKSPAADLVVLPKRMALMYAVFDPSDEWGLELEGHDQFLVDPQNKPLRYNFTYVGGQLTHLLQGA